jgi:E3 ubiquitin-protein ligase RNF14
MEFDQGQFGTLPYIRSELVLTSERSAYLDLSIRLNEQLRLVAFTNKIEQQVFIQHLPRLHITFGLPENYPDEAPPIVKLTTSPSFIPESVNADLEAVVSALWEQAGREDVLPDCVNHIEEVARDAFGFRKLTLTPELLPQLLECDRIAAKAEFDKKSYECSTCLYSKDGSSCYQFEHCGHVFCVGCLQQGYNNAILTGNIEGVRCFNCPQVTRKRQLVTPAELLRIPIPRPAVQRYADMKRKKQLESDPSIIRCPRTWCPGVAEGSAYPKPTVPLEELGDSFNDPPKILVPIQEYDDADDEDTKNKKTLANADRRCDSCGYVFCKFCRGVWHGAAVECRSRLYDKNERAKLSAEDEASEAYINKHTKPCPRCARKIQKSEACNHMRCSECYTHFCYLCGGELDVNNLYVHFNTEGTKCYQKLWELRDGDGGEVQVKYPKRR